MAVQRPLYPLWNTYFSDGEVTESRKRLSRAFVDYFRGLNPPLSILSLESDPHVNVDFSLLAEAVPVENLVTLATDSPNEFLAALSLAAHEVFIGQQAPTGADRILTGRKVAARVYHLPQTPIRNLKSNMIGKLIALRGAVIRVSSIKPLVRQLAFVCSKCGGRQEIAMPEGRYTVPTRCETAQCRSKSFLPDRSSAVTVDWQKIRLQELPSEDTIDAGRVPRTVECELTADLVDCCVPGDVVSVCGVVKVVAVGSETAGRPRGPRNKSMFVLYVDVNSVQTGKQADDGAAAALTIRDMYAVQQIASEPQLFHLIVNSVCPAIFGHEVVKAGLALALFGGASNKHNESRDHVSVRGDPHVLVVGDPGMGKSQMLQAVSALAPRGVYVSGNTTTTSGLTVTVLKDAVTGDYVLEAGALVLGDRGLCCIDEFDKMGADHQALLEAMEQQSVSVAKAGIVCSLPTRTAVIAAANPVGGHYNRAKTVSENLKMNSAVLSRFDLIFILVDAPDAERDQLLSEHVIRLHSGGAARAPSLLSSRASSLAPSQQGSAAPLGQRLKVSAVPNFEPLPAPLLRKYVAYARQYVHPRLTPEAGAVLQQFYLALRRQYRHSDSIPITTRQFEAMIRLAEARAKIELREFVTEQDALDVIAIMQESLYDMFADEYGQLDFRRTSGMSNQREARRFVAELTRIAEVEANSVFSKHELFQIAQDLQLKIQNFDDFLDSLNNQGFLLKKPGNQFQLQTTQVGPSPRPSTSLRRRTG